MITDRPEEFDQEGKWSDIQVFPVNESVINEIKVKKSHIFGLLLESKPSTGFSWQLIPEKTNKVCRFLGLADYEPPDPEPFRFGGKEVVKFVFRSTGFGKAVLKFIYIRPWEKDKPPLKKITVILRVEN